MTTARQAGESLIKSQNQYYQEKTTTRGDRFFLVVLASVRTNPAIYRSAPSARSGEERAEGRPKRARLNQLQQAQIQVMYQHGRSTRYIATHFGIGKTTVLGVLKRRGVQMRPRGQKSISS